MLRLVKDFKNYQFIYFWVDKKGNKQSPHLPTLNHAEEWFVSHCFSSFEGDERRQRTFDRRFTQDATEQESNLRQLKRRNPSGRRSTDTSIKIDVDLSKEKIRNLKQA